jgi:hypothetical protein
MIRAAPQSMATAQTRGGRTQARPFFAGPVQRKSAAEEPATQARLSVSAPGDRWEREADSVAGEVSSGPGPLPGRSSPAERVTPVNAAALRDDPAQRRVLDQSRGTAETLGPTEELAAQRSPETASSETVEEAPSALAEPAQMQKDEPVQQAEEEPAQPVTDDPIQSAEEVSDGTVQRAEADELPAQARSLAAGGPGAAFLAAEAMARARGQGDPLPPLVMDRMQSRFGADFQGIRIHTDSAAVQITRALRAQAVTRGPEIFFNAGRFQPESSGGAELLAHELTHTLQQGAATPAAGSAAGRADPLQLAPEPEPDDESYQVRPEILTAIRLARGEAGKVNAKAHGPDGKRIGWERLQLYFTTALGGPVIDQRIIEKVTPVPATKDREAKADALPSWCGIFTWWAMKEAGLPIPDWTLGKSALDALKLRAKSELPRKGDIAILVKPNNHFAMVTGLETAKDAEGKPRKLVRIATINGNTAGNDNLGGQVQEKWNTLGEWDHFLDPVGKLSLPPAPLVTVSREPTPPEAEAPGAKPVPAAAEAEQAAATAKSAKDAALADLETAPVETPVVEAGLSSETLPQADLTLPPPPPAGPTEVVAEVQAVALDGTSDAATSAWLAAGPSAMAAAQPVLPGAISGKLSAEQDELAANPPKIAARTAGLDDLPDVTPPETTLPEGEVDEAKAKNDPGALDPVKVEVLPDSAASAAQRKKMDEEAKSDSAFDVFTSFLKSLISDIKVTDPSVQTGAGEAPGVDLTGDADATRMDKQRGDASTSVGKARDVQVSAFREHPGQAAIQPVKVDETFDAAPGSEPVEPLEDMPDQGMADFVASPLPEDVRAAADGKLARRLDASLTGPRAEVIAAATTRDTEKDAAIATAEAEAAQINTDADASQKKAVLDNRAEVARLQGEGMTEAHGAVNAFNREAGTKEAATRKTIGTHVRTEEDKARGEITKGETKAETLKTTAEDNAAAKKEGLKDEEKKDGWWKNTKQFLKEAVNTVTTAIDKIFTALRKAVAEVIEAAKNAAIGLINAARDFAITQINDFRTWAKEQVNTYVADTFPGLAKRINGAIDTVADAAVTTVNFVADTAVATVELVADTLAKTLDGLLKAFQTGLKAGVRIAAAAATGDFAEALRVAIEAACEIAGIDSKPVFDFFDRAGKAVDSILKDPVTFFTNLAGAVGAGIGAFFTNIRTHLISGAIAWLTGALAEVQLTGPFEFTVSGILKIVLQILGLTYDAIKARVIKAYPPAAGVFDVVETGFEIVRKLVTEGPMSLLDEILAHLGDLKETVMGAVREWLIVTAIKQGILWLLALTNPASAIVKAVMLIYDLVMFLVERFQQIKDFVMSVYDAVAAVAAGNFSAVTTKVEEALARSVPVLISLLASVLSLGNIAAKVKAVIAKVTKPINKVVDAVVKKIVAFAKKVAKKVGKLATKAKKKGKAAAKKAKQKAKEAVEKIATWWKELRRFKSKDGGSHKIFYKGSAEKADLWVASDEHKISDFLAAKQNDPKTDQTQHAIVAQAAAQYAVVLQEETKLEQLRAATSAPGQDKKAKETSKNALKRGITSFRSVLDDLAQTLSKTDFGDQEVALVQTRLSWTGDGQKNVTALPLTFLPGQFKGSRPTEDPPGWDKAVKLDTIPGSKPGEIKRASTWVRGHLLNDNLHGPGIAKNLVPITQTMNGEMERSVESPAKTAIKQKGSLHFYSAAVTFWPDTEINDLPKQIDVTFGAAKRTEDRKDFEKDKTKPTVKAEIKMTPKPDLSSAGYAPTINGGSPKQLELAIKQHGPVTAYYVNEVLLHGFAKHGAYAGKDDMRDRLYAKVKTDLVQQQGAAVAARRKDHVDATYNAIVAGDVKD